MLEDGYESTYEHLAFRQLKGAYGCKLISIPHDYPTLQEGLDAAIGTKIFMVPPGRVLGSVEYSEYTIAGGDVVFIFGSPQEPLTSYVGDEVALHITTPNQVDMMAVCVAAQVLYDC